MRFRSPVSHSESLWLMTKRGFARRFSSTPIAHLCDSDLGSRPLFGLGEGLIGDRRGARDAMRNGQSSPELRTTGSRVPIPWLISPEGWGIFVGLPLGTFDLTGEMGVVSSPVATSTRNVYLILGDSPAEVLHGYAELTGFPHLPPIWSLGYLQSHRTLANR